MDLAIRWRYFSLEQANSKNPPGWKIWEQPEDYPTRGLRAFRAAEAARLQGDAGFLALHFALLKARHEQRRDIADKNTLIEVAEGVDLDVRRFRGDLDTPGPLTRLAEDHTFAVEVLGVFGTPTLVFPDNQAIFLKMAPPSPQEGLSVFNELRQIAERRRYIGEIKRPQPPTGK